MTHFICLDIDHEHGAMRWAEEYLPRPRWTSQNPLNGHAHIVYELKRLFVPVSMVALKPWIILRRYKQDLLEKQEQMSAIRTSSLKTQCTSIGVLKYGQKKPTS